MAPLKVFLVFQKLPALILALALMSRVQVVSTELVVRLCEPQAPLLLHLRGTHYPKRGICPPGAMQGSVRVHGASWGLAGLQGPQAPPSSLPLPGASPKLQGCSMLVPGMPGVTCAH